MIWHLLILLGLTPLWAHGQPIGQPGGGDAIGSDSVLLLFTERKSDGTPQLSSLPADNPTGSTTKWHFRYDDPGTPGNWTALANDYSDKFVFWSDQSQRAVIKGYFAIHAETIFSGTSDVVQGIAVDWLAKNLYYTDSTYDWIVMTNYNHDKIKFLIDTGLDKPHGLAVHPLEGYIFWTDWGRTSKIERATLFGESRTVLVNTGTYQPYGITVDYGAQRLYWVESDSGGSRLQTCDFDGGYRRTLATTSAANGFFYDLAIFQNTVFISDWKKKKIHFINKNDGIEFHTLSLPSEPFGLTVYGPNQLPTGDTPASCASNPCEHFCTNTASGYQCLCEDHYTLQSDGRTCIRTNEVSEGRVFYVSGSAICSQFGNFLELPESNETCVVNNRNLAVSLAFDVQGRMMFYSDAVRDRVYSVRMENSSPIQYIIAGVGSVEGIAVDWLNQNLYWTDYVYGYISVSRYDGKYRRVIISDEVLKPRSLAIHAGQRVMFWTELDAVSGQIEKAGLDGGNRQIIVANIGAANGLAIDFELDRLYYADRITSTIYSVDFNGNGKTTVYTRPGAEFFDIAIHKDYLLWTEWGDLNPDNRGIRAINRETSEFVKHVPSDTDLYDIKVYDSRRQPTGVAVCGAYNGGCTHLCLPRSSGGYRCACATGFGLASDGRTCETSVRADNFLLMTDSYLRTIFQVDLTNPDLTYSALPLEDLGFPFAITYDSVESKVYWSEISDQTINRANLDGTDKEVLLGPYNGIQSPEGLAIEPIARLLFWTDYESDTISVCRLDGTYKKTLITTGLDKPRGILLDHRNGILVWSDYGATPKIERASLDGSSRHTILSGVDVAAPVGIALDYNTNTIFYCDAFRRVVERIGIDGSNRQAIVQLPADFVPIGITLYQGSMFISDWSVNRLIYATQSGEGLAFVGHADFGRITFPLAYDSSTTVIGSNACSSNMGGCSDLCLATPTGKTCACQDGATLMANNLDCSAPELGFILCPATFANGRVEAVCDRKQSSTCAVECDSGYDIVVEYLTCGGLGSWDVITDTVCRAKNPCLSSPCQHGGTCANGITFYTCACVPGWEGLTCNINFNECGSFPCQNGGSCNDGIDGYTCSCSIGFSGVHCEIGSNPCSNSPCINGGTCVSAGSSFTCNCVIGFTGTICEQEINECTSNPCQNGGTCDDRIAQFACSCVDGFYGTHCEFAIDFCNSIPCWNGATCNSVTNGYTCSCRVGFTGTNCQTNINECSSYPCGSNGMCTDLINSYTCTCQSGFTGDRCQIDINECSSNPCRNGQCTDQVNAYRCNCLSGYVGVHCDTDINECLSSPCANGGICYNLINAFVCTCVNGFTGTMCEMEVNECVSNPCLNSGICIDQINEYICSCTNGYSGDRCEIDTSGCVPNPCQNGGVCSVSSVSFQCSCSQEWSGNLCEVSTNLCSSTPCRNGGTCTGDSTSFTCNCLPGFTGSQCAINENECLSNPCEYGGTCTDVYNGYVCMCQEGTTGINCQINIDECSSSPCGSNGICTDLINSYLCTCQSGFTGNRCQIDVNECSSNPCVNGGTCRNLVNSYSCSCTAGYIGVNCQTRVTCPGLEKPVNGIVTPSSCLSTSLYGDTCVFSCNNGDYVIRGPQVQTCTVSGTWTQQGMSTSCVFSDSSPPVFTTSCPVEIVVTVDTPCSNQALVAVDQPIATDNSGEVTVTPSGSEPEVLDVGRYERTYRAEDAAGNRAECRVVIIVQGIYCSAPPQIAAAGFITSTSCLHTYGSVATYQCYPGYQLMGDNQVQCGMDGSWTGNAPTCAELRCNGLSIPTNGNVSPFVCSDRSVSTGTHCSIWCDTGYELNGADASINCRADGTWSNDLKNAACQDVRAPTITNCGSSFEVNLPPSSASVVVTWPIPTATSGGQLIEVVHTANLAPPATLEPGYHLMEYVARDSEGRESYCRFTIQVNDIEPPSVTSCPTEPIVVETTRFPVVLEWTEPTFADNVDVIEVYQDGMSGISVYSWGTVTVQYIAYDAADNNAECVVTVHVIESQSCSPLDSPVNGALDCQGSTCAAQCNEGFVFTNRNRPPGAYVCLPSGLWNHATTDNPTPALPACVENTLEHSLTWSREDMLVLEGPIICNQAVQEQVSSMVMDNLENSSWMTSCSANSENDCDIGDINVNCNSAQGRRKKRQAQDIVVSYDLTGTREDSTDTAALEQAMAIPVSDLLSARIVVNVNGQDITLNVTEAETGQVKATCEPGQEPAGMICVSCPVGSSFDLTTSGCSPCEVGTYQDREGQLVCKLCPNGTTTAGTGSYSDKQCQESCPPGEFSYLGLTPCQSCPHGTFQSETGQRGCEPCAEGDSTIMSGATSYDQCLAVGSFTPIISTSFHTKEPMTNSSDGGGEAIPLTGIVIGVVVVLIFIVIITVAVCLTRKSCKLNSANDYNAAINVPVYDLPPDHDFPQDGQPAEQRFYPDLKGEERHTGDLEFGVYGQYEGFNKNTFETST